MRLIAVFALVSLCLLRADDITLPDGKVYKNATITDHTPSTVTIMFDDGLVRVPISELSPDLQKKLGYDPEAAKAYDQQKSQEADAVAAEQAAVTRASIVDKELDAKEVKLWVTVSQVLNAHEFLGAIVNSDTRVHLGEIDISTVRMSDNQPGSANAAPGKVPASIVEGHTYVFTVWPHGTYREPTAAATTGATTTPGTTTTVATTPGTASPAPIPNYTGSRSVAAQAP